MTIKMRKSLLIGGAIAAIAIVITAIVLSGVIEQEEDLVLSNYPKLFEKDVVIVIGENATQMEYEGAEAIAENLHNLTGNMPVIKKDTELTEDDKAKYNLILVGSPNTNSVLEEVYEVTDATRVTSKYPGENKGVLEILRNPWNGEKAMLLVEGSDDTGLDIMGQIATQTEKVHLKRVYGPYEGNKSAAGMIGLPNPSAVYCEDLGYRYEIRTKSDGSQIGYCVFDSILGRKECPAWDFYSGLCGEEYTYCSKTGGVLVKIKNAGYVAACVLPSGKICYEWDYSQGGCK